MKSVAVNEEVTKELHEDDGADLKQADEERLKLSLVEDAKGEANEEYAMSEGSDITPDDI